ncbi:MAG: hypothetical protein M1834_004411 [Cirrosporium novae-zelandiae]|nr:MAG: hypothetical protein M1834_004411 [Cirrosporium novae-zelandiae]
MATAKINKYSLPDLKNTTDDHLPLYLSSHPSTGGLAFVPSYYLTDIRLALGYTAVTIAAITFYYDYKLGFEATKHYTFYTVIVYFILNTLLTAWIYFIEKGTVFVGTKGGNKIAIRTEAKKNKPIYYLTVSWGKNDGAPLQEKTYEGSFTQWFTQDGEFVEEALRNWLASSVPVIGKADPSRAAKKSEAPAGFIDPTAQESEAPLNSATLETLKAENGLKSRKSNKGKKSKK